MGQEFKTNKTKGFQRRLIIMGFCVQCKVAQTENIDSFRAGSQFKKKLLNFVFKSRRFLRFLPFSKFAKRKPEKNTTGKLKLGIWKQLFRVGQAHLSGPKMIFLFRGSLGNEVFCFLLPFPLEFLFFHFLLITFPRETFIAFCLFYLLLCVEKE